VKERFLVGDLGAQSGVTVPQAKWVARGTVTVEKSPVAKGGSVGAQSQHVDRPCPPGECEARHE